MLNFRNAAYADYNIGFPQSGTWRLRFNSDYSGYDAAFGNHTSYDTTAEWSGADGMPCSGNVGLGPYTAIILSQ